MKYSNYIQALEMRLRWLKWVKSEAYDFYKGTDTIGALPMYEGALSCGDTFYMNDNFCATVDFARQSIPDDLEFDPAWMVTPRGWMWLEEPFETPKLKDEIVPESRLKVSAIAWFPLDSGTVSNGLNGHPGRKIPENSYEFLCFHDLKRLRPLKSYRWKEGELDGFGCWSYFSLAPGDKVLERIRIFERIANDPLERGNTVSQGAYVDDRELDKLHEARWVYTAMHLMSSKITMTPKREADRHTRRRLEREAVKVEPAYRIVTLRRMEEDRKKDSNGIQVDWQWQWRVHGHWRNHYFPKEETHKTIWIEQYVKGPIDKPLKPECPTIYVAER